MCTPMGQGLRKPLTNLTEVETIRLHSPSDDGKLDDLYPSGTPQSRDFSGEPRGLGVRRRSRNRDMDYNRDYPNQGNEGHEPEAGKKEPEADSPTVGSITREFLETTSAHGLPHVLTGKFLAEKIGWVLVFLGALAYFLFQVTQLFQAFFGYPVAVKTTILQRHTITFPAVTVCNLNILKKSLITNTTKYGQLVELDTTTKAKIVAQNPIAGKAAKRRRRKKRDINSWLDLEGELLAVQPSISDLRKETKARNKRSEEEQRSGRERRDADSYDFGSGQFEYYDTGFSQVKDDFAFEEFFQASGTSDYSDLADVLKPSWDDLVMYGHDAEDFIVHCSFDKEECYAQNFTALRNSQYGNCYTFNANLTEGPEYLARRTSKYGSRYGLRLTLNIEYDEYIGLYAHQVGVRVAVHPHNETPFPEDLGISAAPGMSTQVGVELSRVVRETTPYASNCTKGRDIPNQYLGVYTVTACRATCLQLALYARCGCIDQLSGHDNRPMCRVTNKTEEVCRQRVKFDYDYEKLGCVCPDACEQLHYDMSVSSTQWPSEPYTYILLNNLLGSSLLNGSSDTETVLDRNLVRLQIYMANPNVVSFEEYPSYPWDRLVADIGGLLGLFIGVSICTAIEVILYATRLVTFLVVRGRAKRGQARQIHDNAISTGVAAKGEC